MPKDNIDRERRRVIRAAMKNPRPCLICDADVVVGIGTWTPDKKSRLAVGGNDTHVPIFAFWLCVNHAQPTEDNEVLIRRIVIRLVRNGKKFQV